MEEGRKAPEPVPEPRGLNTHRTQKKEAVGVALRPEGSVTGPG